jgi:hypothetical protein
MLAAFRGANPRRPRRRLAARLGAGGSVFIAAAALSGGVAAASYTNSLPSSAQNIAHTIGGWAGVPKAKPAHHAESADASKDTAATSAGPRTGGTPRTGGSPIPAGSPSATPSPTPRRGAAVPAAGSRAHSPAPSISPSAGVNASLPPRGPAASPAETPTPTPTITTPIPTALSASVDASRVPANTGVTLSGELVTSSGAPVPDHVVRAFVRPTDGRDRVKLGVATTDANGDVSFAVPGLTHDVRLVLRAGKGVHSTPLTVVEVPTVSAAVVTTGTIATIDVSTAGAMPGDAVRLLRRQQGAWLPSGRTQLDADGAASFAVPAATGHPVRYRVVVEPTREHARSAVGCAVLPS